MALGVLAGMKRWFRRVDKRLLAIVTSVVAVALVAIVVVAAMPGGLALFRGKPVASTHKPSCTPIRVASAPGNPYYPPMSSNPYYPPMSSNPYYPPVPTNPYYPPMPTNPYYPPVPTNPY
jgi:hypothetical protein